MSHRHRLEAFEPRVLFSAAPVAGVYGLDGYELWGSGQEAVVLAGKQVESLDRGLHAIYSDQIQAPDGSVQQGVYLSWRLLAQDSPDIGFNVYRGSTKLNTSPIVTTTDYVDSGASGSAVQYTVRAVVDGVERSDFPYQDSVTVDATVSRNYQSLGVSSTPKSVAVGDLDGDGDYDLVYVDPTSTFDPHRWKAQSGTYRITAVIDGQEAWRYDLGPNIELGGWFAPVTVYDLDGDGRAEVIAKGVNAQVDANDYRRDVDGKIIPVTAGPEHLLILDGQGDGAGGARILDWADWPERSYAELGDYNHTSRNQLGIAYLDGVTPSVIAGRGTYEGLMAYAYRFDGTQIVHDSAKDRWTSAEHYGTSRAGDREFWKGGAHSMRTADLNNDGTDEVVLGASILTYDATAGLVPYWGTGLGHADQVYVGDLDPHHPGMEIYHAYEEHFKTGNLNRGQGMSLWDADAPGAAPLWQGSDTYGDLVTLHLDSQGLVADIDPNHDGLEFYSREKELVTEGATKNGAPYQRYANERQTYLTSVDGTALDWTQTFYDGAGEYDAVYWDSDPQREVVVQGSLFDFAQTPTQLVYNERFNGSWLSDWGFTLRNSADLIDPSSDHLLVRQQSKALPWEVTKLSDIPVTGGDQYLIKVEADNRIFSGTTDSHFIVEALDAGGQVIAGSQVDFLIAAGDAMRYHAASIETPANATHLRMRLTGNRNAFDATGDGNGGVRLNHILLLKDQQAHERYKDTTVSGRIIGTADLYGDWREEILVRGNDGDLHVYSTTFQAEDRRVSLMQDPLYRQDVATQAMGYRQTPQTSYWLAGTTARSNAPTLAWSFDGNTQEATAALNAATAVGGSASFADGIADSLAISLDGLDDGLVLAGHSAATPLHAAFSQRTVSAWFNPDNLNGKQLVYEQGDTSKGIAVRLNGNILQARAQHNSDHVQLSATVSANRWTHLALVFDQGNMSLYLDGQLRDSGSMNTPTIGSSSNGAGVGTRMGTDTFGLTSDDHFDGRIDQLQIFDTPLSAGSVASLANFGQRSGPVLSETFNANKNTAFVKTRWTEVGGTNLYTVNDGRLQWNLGSNEVDHKLIHQTPVGTNSFTLEVKTSALDAMGTHHVYFDYQDEDNWVRLRVSDPWSSNAVAFERRVAGTTSLLAGSNSDPIDVNTDDPLYDWQITADAETGLLTFRSNGQTKLTATHTLDPAGGRVGLGGVGRRPIWDQLTVLV